MEDALLASEFFSWAKNTNRLNPCCNGRCSLRLPARLVNFLFTVLILVVMEDALLEQKIKTPYLWAFQGCRFRNSLQTTQKSGAF